MYTGPSSPEPGDVDQTEWEEVEIGKGLAQYNSVEIDRIKGMKRYLSIFTLIDLKTLSTSILNMSSSHIEQILGYSESDHVVDSITFY